MLRDAAAFISFRQPGQSEFIDDVEVEVLETEVLETEVLEIEVIKILCCRNQFWVRERGFSSALRNTANKAAFFRRGERCYRFRNRVGLTAP